MYRLNVKCHPVVQSVLRVLEGELASFLDRIAESPCHRCQYAIGDGGHLHFSTLLFSVQLALLPPALL